MRLAFPVSVRDPNLVGMTTSYLFIAIALVVVLALVVAGVCLLSKSRHKNGDGSQSAGSDSNPAKQKEAPGRTEKGSDGGPQASGGAAKDQDGEYSIIGETLEPEYSA